MLRGLLDGRTTRTQVDAWYRSQPPPDVTTWPWPGAACVYDSLVSMDDRDEIVLRPTIDIEQLPVWSLWRVDHNGNEFEMARDRSYAKAIQSAPWTRASTI